jgi:predicted 2-oxoglutarate/Fe(II)-dependent dioxygenase YbiX
MTGDPAASGNGTTTGRRLFETGERAPDFVARGPSGQAARFYAHAGGRPTAVVFDSSTRGGDDPRIIDLAGRLAARTDVVLCLVAVDPSPDSPVPVWTDPDRAVGSAYGVADGELTAVVLDPNLRVVGTVTGDRLVEEVTALLEAAVHRDPPATVTAQAPVLLLPAALSLQWCQRLIDVWHEAGGVDTGVERGGDEVLDDAYKRRRDHTVGDPELMRELSTVVGRRVMPEVRKAFAYRATRFEGFKIACYDAESGGFFRAHRDNLTRATAHRAFALTLNLNDAYDGGELRFPEYGNQLYRPDAGAALVFSCSQLHEVRPVTAGRRFVLLSFLFDQPTG